MKVSVSNIVKKFKTNITILQTMYEAINNSLEANSNKIEIEFQGDPLLDETIAYSSFNILDNGDGFNDDNLSSFQEYLTDFKIDLGCKGVGRFTWLKVFENVLIVSKLADKTVKINFSLDFQENEDITVIKEENEIYNQTKIVFSGCKLSTNKYVFLTLDQIKLEILNHFAIRFSLLKKKNQTFEIILKDNIGSSIVTINDSDILKLNVENIEIVGHSSNIHLDLYYSFIPNGRGERSIVLCANERGIKDINTKGKIISDLPYKDSLICLVMSKYFDEFVNDERTDFYITDDENMFGVGMKELENRIKNKMEQIVLDKYPQIQDENINIQNLCIDEYPHLKKYIESDLSIIKNQKTLISNAQKAYEDEKQKAKNKFVKLLSARKIDESELIENINHLNDISNKELAQYFLYRQQIIDCLGKYNSINEKNESLVHDLFIPRGEKLVDSLEDRLNNNIWLLDDKFMSCKNLYSDIKVQTIKQEILKEDENNGEDALVEPDLTIFYENKLAIVVEFKALGANYNKKIDAISEINRNNGIVAKNIPNLNAIYGYIITQFDEVFLKRMQYQNGIKRMFTNGEDQMFYFYNENISNSEGKSIPCHTYIISTESIYLDAKARNQLFLDIIKKTNV